MRGGVHWEFSMPLSAGDKLGPYEVLAPIGAGGMGEVYRARDPRLERDVAIKVLPEHLAADPEALARFEREAKAVASISHPNILAIHDFGKDDGVHFAVTELLEGETLRSRLKQSPMSWRKAAEYGVALAEGLAAAHAKGVVHRDLKPENIFLTSAGHVKILDFGLARVRPPVSAQDQGTTLTRHGDGVMTTEPGTLLGTIGYMSPEQVRGQDADLRSDIFSLGCVLYEMAAGKRPFQGDAPAETMAAILKEHPAEISTISGGVPVEFDRLVGHCLEKKPENRFQSARDMGFALRAIASGSQMTAGAAAPAPASKRRLPLPRWVIAAVPLVLAAAGTYFWVTRDGTISSLAVMPFANAGNDPGTEYLSDGITESIINQLAQLPKLEVVPRSTVFRYKGKEVDTSKVGKEFKVHAVLMGRVVARGDNLNISTELVDVRTNRQIWGEQYSRKLADLASVQGEIAREISDKLRLRLSGEDVQRLARRQTQNSEAYQLYLQGRFHWNKRTLEGMQQSIDLFQQAISKDSTYALAHAGLADAFALLADYNVLPAKEVMPRAKTAATRALELDDKLAEAHASLGWAKLMHDWAWADAEREFQRALHLNVNYATARQWNAEFLALRGRFDEALAEVQRAQQAEPASLAINRAVASTFYYARKYDQSIDQARKTILLDPSFVGGHLILGRALAQKGSAAEAVAEFQKAFELSQGDSNELAALGHSYAVAGRAPEARKTLQELKDRASQTYVQPVWIALIHAALGEKDAAFEWLEKAYGDRSGWLVYLKSDPLFQPLRSDARFTELARRVGLPD